MPWRRLRGFAASGEEFDGALPFIVRIRLRLQQPRRGIDFHKRHPVGNFKGRHRQLLERLFHELNPDRQGRPIPGGAGPAADYPGPVGAQACFLSLRDQL